MNKMKSNISLRVIVRDSLGHVVTQYRTQLPRDAFERIKSSAEYDNESRCFIRDCEVDGELGWKEYYL